jgi:hypothetical protein
VSVAVRARAVPQEAKTPHRCARDGVGGRVIRAEAETVDEEEQDGHDG